MIGSLLIVNCINLRCNHRQHINLSKGNISHFKTFIIDYLYDDAQQGTPKLNKENEMI